MKRMVNSLHKSQINLVISSLIGETFDTLYLPSLRNEDVDNFSDFIIMYISIFKVFKYFLRLIALEYFYFGQIIY